MAAAPVAAISNIGGMGFLVGEPLPSERLPPAPTGCEWQCVPVLVQWHGNLCGGAGLPIHGRAVDNSVGTDVAGVERGDARLAAGGPQELQGGTR